VLVGRRLSVTLVAVVVVHRSVKYQRWWCESSSGSLGMRCLCHREGRYILSPQNNVDEASGDQLITLICDTTGVDVEGIVGLQYSIWWVILIVVEWM
jgi:hypothetical protein